MWVGTFVLTKKFCFPTPTRLDHGKVRRMIILGLTCVPLEKIFDPLTEFMEFKTGFHFFVQFEGYFLWSLKQTLIAISQIIPLLKMTSASFDISSICVRKPPITIFVFGKNPTHPVRYHFPSFRTTFSQYKYSLGIAIACGNGTSMIKSPPTIDKNPSPRPVSSSVSVLMRCFGFWSGVDDVGFVCVEVSADVGSGMEEADVGNSVETVVG